jgi:hypothetical protein
LNSMYAQIGGKSGLAEIQYSGWPVCGEAQN